MGDTLSTTKQNKADLKYLSDSSPVIVFLMIERGWFKEFVLTFSKSSPLKILRYDRGYFTIFSNGLSNISILWIPHWAPLSK